MKDRIFEGDFWGQKFQAEILESLEVVGQNLELIDSVLAKACGFMGPERGTSITVGGFGRRDGNVFLAKKS